MSQSMIEARLEYAPGAPLRRRKRRRRLIAIVLLLGVAAVGYRLGPEGFRRAMVLYRQHRCLAYAPPADQVVYDEASSTTADRAKQAGWVVVNMPRPWGTITAAAWQAPALVDAVADLPPMPVVAAPPSPGSSGTLARSLGMPSGGTLFLHELRNKAGMRRLAVVQRVPSDGGPFLYPLGLQVAVFEPATFWSRGKNVGRPPVDLPGDTRSGIIPRVPIQPLRFYAGQADPNDPAHFTIRYELAGTAGVLDGRLNETGDDLVLKIVSGPATAPSMWTTWVLPQ
jgi:hypothetical protein